MNDVQYSDQMRLFKLMGVQFSATRNAWGYPLWNVALGLLIAAVFHWANGPSTVLTLGLVYAVLLMLTYFFHTLGHIISAREVNAPMIEHIVTAGIQRDVYPNDRQYPREVHVGRAIGGPLMSLTLSLLTFLLWAFIPGWAFLVFAASNLIWGIVSLLPIRGMDGDVLWRGRIS
jgi:Zn-dependent protease